MAKQRIRLTEGDLRKIIEGSVRQYLRENDMEEGFFDFLGGASKKVAKDTGEAARKGVENMRGAVDRGIENGKRAIGDVRGKVRNGVDNAVGSVKRGFDNAKNMAKDGMKSVEGYANDLRKAGNDASMKSDLIKMSRQLAKYKDRIREVNPKAGKWLASAINGMQGAAESL